MSMIAKVFSFLETLYGPRIVIAIRLELHVPGQPQVMAGFGMSYVNSESRYPYATFRKARVTRLLKVWSLAGSTHGGEAQSCV